jgi:hypothetical protein
MSLLSMVRGAAGGAVCLAPVRVRTSCTADGRARGGEVQQWTVGDVSCSRGR